MNKVRTLLFIIPLILLCACAKPVFKSKWVRERSPEKFTARFETNKGSFDVEIVREYSPQAVDRIYQQLKHRYYDKAVFYRADSGFVAQFGISDTIKYHNWDKYKIPDEQVLFGNKKGTITFARGGKETRGSDLFINLKDNSRLDTITFSEVKGFPAFGSVINHLEVVESIYTGYGDSTMQKLDTFYLDRAHFFSMFPKLDSIKKAYILR